MTSRISIINGPFSGAFFYIDSDPNITVGRVRELAAQKLEAAQIGSLDINIILGGVILKNDQDRIGEVDRIGLYHLIKQNKTP